MTKLNLYKSTVVPVLPVLLSASPCFGLNKYVLNQLEIIRKHVVKWILAGDSTYEENFSQLQIFSLPVYIQMNNMLLLSNFVTRKNDLVYNNIPNFLKSSRSLVFQLKRPKRWKAEQDFFHPTCRLVNGSPYGCKDYYWPFKVILETPGALNELS